jgi:hypothetical protein
METGVGARGRKTLNGGDLTIRHGGVGDCDTLVSGRDIIGCDGFEWSGFDWGSERNPSESDNW